MSNNKKDLYVEKMIREKKLSDLALEEHHINIKHKEAINNLELEYKKNLWKLCYKKLN